MSFLWLVILKIDLLKLNGGRSCVDFLTRLGENPALEIDFFGDGTILVLDLSSTLYEIRLQGDLVLKLDEIISPWQ